MPKGGGGGGLLELLQYTPLYRETVWSEVSRCLRQQHDIQICRDQAPNQQPFDLVIVQSKVLHDGNCITVPPIIYGTQTILLICLTGPSLLGIFLFALKEAFQSYTCSNPENNRNVLACSSCQMTALNFGLPTNCNVSIKHYLQWKCL